MGVVTVVGAREAAVGSDPLLELHDPEAGLFLFLAPFHAFRQLDVTRFHGDLLELKNGTEK